MPDQIGNINNLISQKSSAPRSPKPPSRIEVVERRIDTLESTLKTVVSELTALREILESQRRPKETATPKATAKQEAKSASSQTPPPPPKKVSKRPASAPWDDKAIREELEACRRRVRALLETEKEITKQGCADALGIAASLAGRTLSYMMTQTKEIEMISPPPTENDPDPKKIFRLKT